MTVEVTGALAALAVAIGVFCGWRGAQPARVGHPRLVPWRVLMLLAFVAFLMLAIHLVALLRHGG